MDNALRLFLVLFSFGLIISCQLDRNKKVERQKFQFKVGADANLFFRNVRQIYYDRESPDGKWRAYRLSDRTKEVQGHGITAVIVIHWLKDEAYLLIEPTGQLGDEETISVVVRNPKTDLQDTVQLKERGRERMLEFGSKIYEATQNESQLSVLLKGKYVPLFENDIDREAFRITLSDYYRLTGIF
jgi:hypothetical protein